MVKEAKDLVRVSSSMREGPIVRGKDGYYRILHARDWGKILIPSENPEGVVLSDFELEGIQINPDFPKIPAELWSPYIELCFFMCPEGKKLNTKFHESQLEVQVCLLRDAETRTKWKIVVPKQQVSGVSVKAELAENIDIVTGEKYKQFPPHGWVHAGSSHSHNTMDSFFSSIDDKSELTIPGLHIVIGSINHSTHTYSYESSVVLRKTRKVVELEEVLNIELAKNIPLIDFHPDVIDYIDTVVSANRKLYKNKEEEEKKRSEEKSTSTVDLSDINMSLDEFMDEEGKISSFLYSLDESNSDLFDGVSGYPFDDEVEEIVNESLDAGFSFNDIIQSLFKARKKRRDEGSSFVKQWSSDKNEDTLE